MKQNIEKPYILYVAEIIYKEICNLKKKNNINNIEAFERFIGSETYEKISSGKFHDEWFSNLKQNNGEHLERMKGYSFYLKHIEGVCTGE